MKEYIEREAVCYQLAKQVTIDGQPRAIKRAAKIVADFPAADVRPVRRGKWENNHCSACGMMPMGEEIWECCDFAPPKFEWFMNYCPNCGAWMEES